MDKENNNINVDEFVEIHNSFLEGKTSDLFFKKEKLKNIIQKGRGTVLSKKPKLYRLISVYSFMIIIFTIFSFIFIDHFYYKHEVMEKDEINFSLFLDQSPIAINLVFNEEVKR